MTCWLCHGEQRRRPCACWACREAQFDYGLLLATAAVLDDANAERGRIPARARFPVGTHGARAAAAGGARAAGSDRRVRPRCHRARLSFGTLRGDRARPPGDARHRQPDQRPRHPRRAGAGAGELVRLGGRGGALARTADRAGGPRRHRDVFELPSALDPSTDRGDVAARPAVRSAQPGHARPAARFVSRACSGPTRSTATPRCQPPRRRPIPPMYAAAPVRRTVAARDDRSGGFRAPRRRPEQRPGAASRAGARSSRSGSSARSPTARSSSARRGLCRGQDRRAGAGADRRRRSRSTRSWPCAAPTAIRRRRWKRRCRSRQTRRRSDGARTATSRHVEVDELKSLRDEAL